VGEPRRGEGARFLVTCAAGWEREAREELRQALCGAHVEHLFLRGDLLLRAPFPKEEAVARLSQAETTVVSRVVPIVGELPVGQSGESLAAVAEACAELVPVKGGECFVVRAHRRGTHQWTSTQLKQAVARAIEGATGATGDYLAEKPDWVVQLEVFQGRIFVGFGRPEEFLQKEVSRRRRYLPGERPVSRAQHKLREAVAAFGIPLSLDWRVLDMGSAPGGWASYLAREVREVVAVDPAELAEEVRGLPSIRHHRQHIEEFLASYAGEPFDMVTNDMNVAPDRSARLMVEAVRLLRPGGWAVMTVKYVSRRRRELREEAERSLAQAYEQIHFRRLRHNRLEVTVAMRRKQAEVSS
jgi:tRNA(Ser,Leu) C12 N-acetylase TAN1/23S rRNA U2552 (ribose-2'-O)-methylase RlmE/FtsJ